MCYCHVSTVAQSGQTKHWLQRGSFLFLVATVEGEARSVQLVAICNHTTESQTLDL